VEDGRACGQGEREQEQEKETSVEEPLGLEHGCHTAPQIVQTRHVRRIDSPWGNPGGFRYETRMTGLKFTRMREEPVLRP